MTEWQYGCGKELIWDKARLSQSGKMIPIEKGTNEPHNCPNSPYNKGKTVTQVENKPHQETLEATTGGELSLAERIAVLETAVATIQSQLKIVIDSVAKDEA